MEKKERLWEILQTHREEIFARGDAFFQCAELGFREVNTANAICRLLEEWGVRYERDIAVTGIHAVLGEGSYHIAFVSDMDALPAQSGGTIHSCGHSIQTTLALSVIQALKESGILDGSDVKVSFFFTPAEEFIDFSYRDALIAEGKISFRSGKQNMIVQGCFDDVDCVISAHANGEKDARFDIGSTLAGFLAKKAVFHGAAAHSGVAAHLGKNALHGAVLCQNAIAFLKDQFPAEAGIRLHPVLTECQGGVNTIPYEAVLEMYLRANTAQALFDCNARTDRCIRASAEALGLEVLIEDTVGYLPLAQSKALNRVVYENMLPFARSKDDVIQAPISGASGDVGDLGYLLPTVQFGFSGITGRFHSDEFVITDRENCYLRSAQVVCGVIADLLEQPALRVYPEGFWEKKADYLQNWLNVKD